jgi:hypothetical protein
MKSTLLSVGDGIEARCTDCRKITNHIIVKMVGRKPAKVLCNTCLGEHQFRSPEVSPDRPLRTIGSTVPRQEVWSDSCAGTKGEGAKNYSMEESYKIKSLIRHPIFGIGLVQRIVGERKIEVLFEDGKKTMRCNNG